MKLECEAQEGGAGREEGGGVDFPVLRAARRRQPALGYAMQRRDALYSMAASSEQRGASSEPASQMTSHTFRSAADPLCSVLRASLPRPPPPPPRL